MVTWRRSARSIEVFLQGLCRTLLIPGPALINRAKLPLIGCCLEGTRRVCPELLPVLVQLLEHLVIIASLGCQLRAVLRELSAVERGSLRSPSNLKVSFLHRHQLTDLSFSAIARLDRR